MWWQSAWMPLYPCVTIDTARLQLRLWREADRNAFAALNADPEVMRYLGGPLDREESDDRVDTYLDCFRTQGFCRWAVTTCQGDFIGSVGVMAWPADGEPLGAHVEIGWRLVRTAWGKGYATEAARASLHDVFTRAGLREVLACTDRRNLPSQAVMARLKLERDSARDFIRDDTQGVREFWVWIARPEMLRDDR
ncbi:GNAT family N-acetyltransferase [Chelatococcus sp. GCM10030263]|uniref:GNAT family N-acetyltransferase n=1 Tax=Chelatococcus sp. GCM10030263 TaxID=3273387 RepID=UPI003618EFE0